jgi:hypothetical protein
VEQDSRRLRKKGWEESGDHTDYVWSEILAKRSDMVLYNPEAKEEEIELPPIEDITGEPEMCNEAQAEVETDIVGVVSEEPKEVKKVVVKKPVKKKYLVAKR